MSVNTMGIEQAYLLVKELHEQATGRKVLTAVDGSNFISVAQDTLQAGTEPLLNAISTALTKSLIAVRGYNSKFGGLEYSADRWGGITRKINFADTDAVLNAEFALVDGASVDQYTIKKPNVLETRYVGSDTWQGKYTLFQDQLNTAFSGPEELASFFSGLMLHFDNEVEQWIENMGRFLVANLIGTLNVLGTGHVIHLLSEYNSATGLSLTKTTVRQPSNYPAFIKWCYARVEQISRMFTERSQKFQQVITGKPIMRHTPVEDQKIYLDADMLSHIRSEVLSSTYNDSYLSLADTVGVNFWQNIDSPSAVNVKPVYIDATGAVTVAGSAQNVTDIAGVIFDRDCLGYNVKEDNLEYSPYNADGRYRNMFRHLNYQYCQDVTEKAVLLLVD